MNAQMMIFLNAATKAGKCPKAYAEGYIKVFSCVCPHVGEEIWSILGHEGTIAYESWPTYDENAIKEDTIEIAVQINGKVKGTVEIAVDEAEDSVKSKAHEVPSVAKALDGKTIVKEIYVKGKILNIVAK